MAVSPPDDPKKHTPLSAAGSGWRPLDTMSLGSWIIVAIAVVSSVIVLALPVPDRPGLEFWTFARNHSKMYAPLSERWNRRVEETGEGELMNLYQLEFTALERRTLNGFWAGTPLADLIEIEGGSFYKFVTGPLEDVGFVDLTDLLHDEGIYETLNAPSLTAWTNRGRVFGLPHDVHPVLLAYRADIVEDELGIDVSTIQTWDDFARVMSAAKADFDGDGRIDRYPLSFWFNDVGALEVLMLQAGGGTFDADDNIIVASEANARVLATAVSWCFGEDRIAIDAPEFDAGGNQLKLDGRVVCAMMPDWLAGIWKSDLPQLGGKIKLMPLPAWEPGGRRTSVRGGTMLGIPRATVEAGEFEDAWAFAKYLYLAEEVARELFLTANIISPVKSYWDRPFYHEPDPYFSGQPSGTLYIDQAPHVPPRTSHPFRVVATTEIGRAANSLRNYADARGVYDVESLLPEARRLLAEAQEQVLKRMERNVFLQIETAGGETDNADTDADAGGSS
ncbi:MAG: extracellular solute-binding protein [Planctomycetota bacterium]